MLAINATGNSWPDARKRAMLIHALGTEGQRLFYTLPNTGGSYDEAMVALEAQFVPKVNIVVARHQFRQRAQRSDETVPEYIAALRELVATCAYNTMENEMLRDQLVEKAYAPAVRERLLMETSLTLESAINLASQVEHALQSSSVLASGATVHAVAQQKPRQRRENKRRPDSKHCSSQNAQQRTQRTCFRCGSATHLANATECPAAKVKCNTCGKTGHFAKVCRSAKQVREVVPEVVVLMTSPAHVNAVDRIQCNVHIEVASGEATDCALLVDTGSSVSIIPEELYKRHFSLCPLTKPKVKLVTYLKETIPVLGCLQANVSIDPITAPASLYVVRGGTALLGMDLIRALKWTLSHDSAPSSSSADLNLAPPTTPVMETKSEPSLLGCVSGFVHKVKIRDNAVPVQQKLRRLPFAVRQSVSEELDKLLKAGIIEKIDASPWISPIVVTTRKGGKPRLCVDLREPNKAIVADTHPLPHMEELLSELRGSSVFSTIDLASAYHQLPLHEDSRDLTGFITHDGLFRYCRVPYGLVSAPSAFQKMMETVLKGLPGVRNYLDDVIVAGSSLEEHDRSLRAVLQRLTDAGLTLNMDKCSFRKSSLRFLGHVISKEGILPDTDHIIAIRDAPAPHDLASLRSFLGLTSWYSKFLPNFATIVEPMRVLQRDAAASSFEWTVDADNSFKKLKQLILDSPVLALFDPSLPTFVTTDASDYGLGAVLTQLHPDRSERTVAFASRTLTTAERKYSTVEKEALACVWAVEKWRSYLWGQRFTLRTDHQALTTLLATKGIGRAGMRVARWSARLLCFTYGMEYKPGSQNQTADCLSRLPLPANTAAVEEPEMVASVLPALSVSDFTSSSAQCPELTLLRAQIQKGWPKCKKHVDSALAPYFLIRHELSASDTLVMRGEHRYIVPVSLRSTVVHLAHDTHQGVVRTKQRLRELYWWPQMDKMVESIISACITCQLNDKSAKTAPAPLQPIELPDKPWDKVGLDIMGPFENAPASCRFAISLVDYYSKWPEVAFSSHVTADVVIAFLQSLFSREGNPSCIVTDNGPQFLSSVFADFLAERGICHMRTSVYYPQCNGAVERWNRVLKECILAAEQMQKSWKPAVTAFLQNYRATPHATTGVSPSELLHNRKMRTKLDIFPVKGKNDKCATVRDTVEVRQKKWKEYTDERRGAKAPMFKPGDWVRVKRPDHVHKGTSKFTAPLRIQKQIGPGTFVLSDNRKWNASRLTHYSAGLGFPAVEPAHTAPVTCKRSNRVTNPPSWLKDFHLG